MPLSALSLVLLSALIHAGWNALAKQAADKFSFIWLAFLINAVWQIPYVVYCFAAAILDWSAWPWFLATTLTHSLYLWLLSEAYRLGDYSIAYPISRGLGVALVPIGGWLLLHEQLSHFGSVGIGLVLSGILFVGLSSTIGIGGPSRIAALAAIGTGLCVASYNLIDKQAMQVTGIGPLPWICMMMLCQTIVLLPLALRRRQALHQALSGNLPALAACSAGSLLSYLLVLHAFSLAPTAYVVASRECSIVFSVLIGSLLLRETQFKRRLGGALAIVGGVAIIALWG